ncbi:hypothetical protein [Cutibacterium avidum]|uniref:hypothetical protein n=1 Tax=Cutibacterium avidum TaxID=33010 RepID=UPI001C324BB1|nr:hypothetical protein [Cutibacterium avidum]BCQ03148.1 hypothetical protein TPCV4_15920 [Cutibacterium avidum]
MFEDKTATSIEAGSAAITGDQAEACSQLLRDHDAADLIDMLIDPRQIAPDDPGQPHERPRRNLQVATAFFQARRVA